MCRVLSKSSVPDTVGHRERARLQWVNVRINEIETVPVALVLSAGRTAAKVCRL